jgi:hypothetical protein
MRYVSAEVQVLRRVSHIIIQGDTLEYKNLVKGIFVMLTRGT